MQTPHAASQPGTQPVRWSPMMASLIAEGDQRWAQRRFQARESEPALPWPHTLLTPFLERMAEKALDVDAARMWCDRSYAMGQLMRAHRHGDPELHWLAAKLFKQYEYRQSGIREVH